MALSVSAKITFKNIQCEKCDSNIYPKDNAVEIKCSECGAFYILSSNVEDSINNNVAIFEFLEYRCIHRGLAKDRTKGSLYEECCNPCPSGSMYCREHCSDGDIESAENSVSYAHKRLRDAEEDLDNLKESKKIWLIEEISGINEDDSVSED